MTLLHRPFRPLAGPSTPTPTISFDWSAGLDGNWTYGGGTNGTRWNSAGALVPASSGRLFYDPATLVFDGLMGEEARTNVVLNPNDRSSDGLINASITADTTTSPDGTTNADTINWAFGTGNAIFTPAVGTLGLSANTTASVSAFFKSGTFNFIGPALGSDIQGWLAAFINSSDGTSIGSTLVGASAVQVGSAFTQKVSQGFFRSCLAGNVPGSGVNWYAEINRSDSVAPTGQPNFGAFPVTPGVGTHFIWQMQVEAGSFSSSPIVTAATRTRDTATSTNATLLAARAYVVNFRAAPFIDSGQTQILFQPDDGTDNNRVRIERQSDTSVHFIVTVGGVNQCDLNLGNVAHNTTGIAAVRWGANDFAGSLNGAAVVTDTSGTVPTPTAARLFTNVAGTNYWMGTVSQLVAYSSLTNAFLVSLSGGTGGGGGGGGGPTPPTPITNVAPGSSRATIQAQLNAVPVGGSLVFPGGNSFDWGGGNVIGKSGITVWADGVVTINNTAGAHYGSFDFSNCSNWTVRGKAPAQGFVFNGGGIGADSASNWAVGNNTFNDFVNLRADGDAIAMNETSFGLVINNDFNRVEWPLGNDHWDNVTIDGNHFIDCSRMIGITFHDDPARGRNIVIQRNYVNHECYGGIEIQSSGAPEEGYCSNLLIDNNQFVNWGTESGGDAFWPHPAAVVAISVVARHQTGTIISNNYINQGTHAWFFADCGIELSQTVGVPVECFGNTFDGDNVGFANGIHQFGTVGNAHDNQFWNCANVPGGGMSGANNVTLGAKPAVPPLPTRIVW